MDDASMRYKLYSLLGEAMRRRPNESLGWILSQAVYRADGINAGNASDEELIEGLQILDAEDAELRAWREAKEAESRS